VGWAYTIQFLLGTFSGVLIYLWGLYDGRRRGSEDKFWEGYEEGLKTELWTRPGKPKEEK